MSGQGRRPLVDVKRDAYSTEKAPLADFLVDPGLLPKRPPTASGLPYEARDAGRGR